MSPDDIIHDNETCIFYFHGWRIDVQHARVYSVKKCAKREIPIAHWFCEDSGISAEVLDSLLAKQGFDKSNQKFIFQYHEQAKTLGLSLDYIYSLHK